MRTAALTLLTLLAMLFHAQLMLEHGAGEMQTAEMVCCEDMSGAHAAPVCAVFTAEEAVSQPLILGAAGRMSFARTDWSGAGFEAEPPTGPPRAV